jgi:hypothetical protein
MHNTNSGEELSTDIPNGRISIKHLLLTSTSALIIRFDKAVK